MHRRKHDEQNYNDPHRIGRDIQQRRHHKGGTFKENQDTNQPASSRGCLVLEAVMGVAAGRVPVPIALNGWVNEVDGVGCVLAVS